MENHIRILLRMFHPENYAIITQANHSNMTWEAA